MQGIATEKVPGGKLLKIKVDYNGRINSVKITGDFFIHPEESIGDREKSLVGVEANAEEVVIVNIVSEVVKAEEIELIGINPEAIARVVKGAMK